MYEYGPYKKSSIKLNYNCPESEKSGSGPGSCGGSSGKSDVREEMKSNPAKVIKSLVPSGASVDEDGFSWSKKGGYAGEKTIETFKKKYSDAGWKPEESKSTASPDGEVVRNSNKLISPDGNLEISFERSYGVMPSDNRYYMTLRKRR